MEKLELKHLAPYLPYGLKVSINNPLLPKLVIEGFNTNIIYLNYHGYFTSRYLHEIKPILRKLSDITKEIEVNDERFVPADIIFPKKECKSEYERNILIGVLEFENVIKHSCTYFGIVQKLFEWHFDVFGLIEKGLAIDINTIENK